MDIAIVVGARPNYPKVAPLCRALDGYAVDGVRYCLIDTGQHYDPELAGAFVEAFGMRPPDVSFGKTTGSHAEQTAKILVEFERHLLAHPTDRVVVVGDVNSTLACSLAAVKLGVPVSHVEAGLRSRDRTMPEEINRLLTDAIADQLFTSEPSGTANLKAEGVDPARIIEVGNVMIDTLVAHLDRARELQTAAGLAVEPGRFALVTLHRPANTDQPERRAACLRILRDVASRFPVVLPLHPRMRNALQAAGELAALEADARIHLSGPIGYLPFLDLQASAAVVLTDSGGIQEETTYLGVPCLTLRPNTERPITVEVGTNELVDLDEPRISAALDTIAAGNWKRGRKPELWDGHAADRIANHLRREPGN